jgi:rsbT co-antagonist protein RsbR
VRARGERGAALERTIVTTNEKASGTPAAGIPVTVKDESRRAEQPADIAKLVAELTLDAIADGVAVFDPHGKFVHFNKAAAEIAGLGRIDTAPDQWSSTYGIYGPDMVTPWPTADLPTARALKGEKVDGVEHFVRHRGKPEGVWVLVSSRPIIDDTGALRGAVTVFRDISERKRWEREVEEQLARERERALTLERMRNAMQELSTPVLEVWDDVLALPVIGVVDSRRSADMMERLLREVEHKQCRFVIIDITGVEIIDTATADHFIKIVNAVNILGARCFLTGARGAVAQTLASLGMDLTALVTLRNLKHALRECLRLQSDASRQPHVRDIVASRLGARRE